MIAGISKIMPIQKVSISGRNSQLSRDRGKKKEQAAPGARFTPIEPAKPTTTNA
jgi:hypothetical protein